MKYTHWPSSRSSSGSTNTHAHIHPFLLLNISMYTLVAICFMIYTTELNYAHAEGEEDLGSASASLGASVTVGTACNFSGSVNIPHTSTIMNGVNSTDIGKTTMNVTCNDQGGYAVYAVGYTNDEYGNNTLQSSVSDDYNIFTGTSTSGNTSNWSMKLATVPGTTTATIENGYDNYNTVPDDYTKVASLNTITDPSTPNTGSSISTTYQTYISPAQPAGTYSGKVRYTLVHPSTNPAPIPMQDIDIIKSHLVNIGDSMQAIDRRDNKVYWIAKLADGNIWMTQNLDLDLDATKTYTPADTDITANWTPARSTINFTGTSVSGWARDYYSPYSANPGDIYYYTSGTDDDDIFYSSLSDCVSAGHSDCAYYHAGNYYNWSAAVASNDTSAITGDYTNATTSVCPAGWKLPSNRVNGESAIEGNIQLAPIASYSNILGEYSTGSLPGGHFDYLSDGFNAIRAAPLWFNRSGSISSGSLNNPAYWGNYWSSTTNGNYDAYELRVEYVSLDPAVTITRSAGLSIRCMVR